MIADSGGAASPDTPELVMRAAKEVGRRTLADTVAMNYMAGMGFHFTGTTAIPESGQPTYVYCQRWTEDFVDLACLTVDDECPEPSGCNRYPRAGFPWRKGEEPDPVGIALGTIPEVARQVSEWPV